LQAEQRAAEDLPYIVDEIALSRYLGVQEEDIGAFLKKWERTEDKDDDKPTDALDFLGAVLGLLQDHPDEPIPVDGTGFLQQVTAAVAGRLLHRGLEVWPLGLVCDGDNRVSTHYLQQDLKELIRGKVDIVRGTAGHAYLTGESLPQGRRVHCGPHRGHCLTDSQRVAAETFLGSDLTAVQGPPGTGKTELILALATQTLIERMAACGSSDQPLGSETPWLLVTSTNNRAVDNVIDPLAMEEKPDRLPLALRLGSRQVIQSVTIGQLQRTAEWLDRAQPNRDDYHGARRRLTDLLGAIDEAEAPLLEARQNIAAIEETEQLRAALRRELDQWRREAPTSPISEQLVSEAWKALKTVRRQVRKRRRNAENKDHWSARACRRHLAALRKSWRHKLAPALAEVGLDIPPPPEPQEKDETTDWEEFFDYYFDGLDEVQNAIDDLEEKNATAYLLKRGQQQLSRLEAELTDLEASRVDTAHLEKNLEQVASRHEEALALLALDMREAWAALHRDRLLESIRQAIDYLEDNASFKSLARAERGAHKDLMQLFPTLGCTLLSLGNCFPLKERSIPRVVIDEAGQCHPAYALSALVRGHQVLAIGDVHQLEPVIELNEREEGRLLRRLALGTSLEQLEPYRVHSEAHASCQSLVARATTSLPSLRDHFRCQANIIDISNQLCRYDLQVRTPPARVNDPSGLLRGPVLGIATAGEQRAFIGSWRNNEELDQVAALTHQLLAAGLSPDRLALLTPYRGQLRAMEDRLRRQSLPLENSFDPGRDGDQLPPRRGIALGTTHRFQGGERDVVVLSMVISRRRSLPFVNARPNLVNVAVSRARLHLVVVGNPEILASGAVTRRLVEAIPGECWLQPPTRKNPF
jgi:hypothetical protein